MGCVQGVQGLREEMRDIVERSEKMREEHSSLLRQSQVRRGIRERIEDEIAHFDVYEYMTFSLSSDQPKFSKDARFFFRDVRFFASIIFDVIV